MRELNVNEIKNVNGGLVALYWVGVGAIHAYRTYSAVRAFSGAFAAGSAIGYIEP